MKKVCLGLLITVLVVGFLLVGCAEPAPTMPTTPTPTMPTTPTPKPTLGPEGTLRVTVGSTGTESFIPERGQMVTTFLRAPIYDAPIIYNPVSLKYEPSLATEWSFSPDKTEYTFKLRKGVQFHDGWGEFTAEDFKYSVERQASEKSTASSAGRLRKITKIEIVDPYTIKFEGSERMDLEWDFCNMQDAQMICKKYVEQVGFDEANLHPIGTGPYKLKEWKPGESITLEAVDNHWRKTSEYKYVVLSFVSEDSTRLARLLTGEADIIGANIGMVTALEKSKDVRIVRDPQAIVQLIIHLNGQYLPTREGYDSKCPFLDIRVRKALNLAINRQELIDTFLYGMGEPAYGRYVAPGVSGWRDYFKPYDYNPAEAKRLIAEAYPDGFDMEFWLTSGTRESQDIYEAIVMTWNQLGIRAKIKYVDNTVMTGKRRNREMSGVAAPVAATLNPTAEVGVDGTYFSWGVAPIAEREDMEAIGNALKTESDYKKRDELYAKLFELVHDEYMCVPVLNTYGLVAVSDSRIAEFTNMGMHTPWGWEYTKKR